jgi:hypothetical protein
MNTRKGKKFCKKCVIPETTGQYSEEDKRICEVCTCNKNRQKTVLILYGDVKYRPENYCFTAKDAQREWSEEMSHICPGDGSYWYWPKNER